jgi:hypothetical protein
MSVPVLFKKPFLLYIQAYLNLANLTYFSGWIILEKMRVPGVLQRFAITYLIVASSAFLFSQQGDEENKKEEKVRNFNAG